MFPFLRSQFSSVIYVAGVVSFARELSFLWVLDVITI